MTRTMQVLGILVLAPLAVFMLSMTAIALGVVIGDNFLAGLIVGGAVLGALVSDAVGRARRRV